MRYHLLLIRSRPLRRNDMASHNGGIPFRATGPEISAFCPDCSEVIFPVPLLGPVFHRHRLALPFPAQILSSSMHLPSYNICLIIVPPKRKSQERKQTDFGKSARYCSICLPRNPAADCRSFCSTSPMCTLLSFCRSTTLPMMSPSQRMGAMASC